MSDYLMKLGEQQIKNDTKRKKKSTFRRGDERLECRFPADRGDLKWHYSQKWWECSDEPARYYGAPKKAIHRGQVTWPCDHHYCAMSDCRRELTYCITHHTEHTLPDYMGKCMVCWKPVTEPIGES